MVLRLTCIYGHKIATVLKVPNCQLIILMLYNIKLSYTWSELLERTNLGEDRLNSQLSVLTKRNFLLRYKDQSSLDPKLASYKLNMKLECTKAKIKIDQQSKKESSTLDLGSSQKQDDSDKKLVTQVIESYSFLRFPLSFFR